MENLLTFKVYTLILFGEKTKILSYINFLYGRKKALLKDLRMEKDSRIYINQILLDEEKVILNIYALPGFDTKNGNQAENVQIAQQLSDILINDDHYINRITFLYLQSIEDKILNACYYNLKMIYDTMKQRFAQAKIKYFTELKSFNQRYIDTTSHKLLQATTLIVTFLENLSSQEKEQKIKLFNTYKASVEKDLTNKYYKKQKKVQKKDIEENPLEKESQGTFEFLQIFFPTSSVKEMIEMLSKPTTFIPNLIFFPTQMISISSSIRLIKELLPSITSYKRIILLPIQDEQFEKFVERLLAECETLEKNSILELPMNWYKRILLSYPELLPHLKSKCQFQEKNILLFPSELSTTQLRTIIKQNLLKIKLDQFNLGTIVHCFLMFLTMKHYPPKDILQEQKVLLGSLLHYISQLTKLQTEISKLPQDANLIKQLFNLLEMLPNTLLQNIGTYFNKFLASLLARETARMLAPNAAASFASVVLLVGQTGYDLYNVFEFRMSTNQLKKNLVVNSSSAGGAIGMGIIAGSVLGPPGMLVGGLVGGGVGYLSGKKAAKNMGKDDNEIRQIFKHEIDKYVYQSLLVVGEIERVEKLAKQVEFNMLDLEQWQKRKTQPEKKNIVRLISKQKGIQSIVESIWKDRAQLKEQWETSVANQIFPQLSDLITNMENQYELAKDVLWQFLMYQENVLSFTEEPKKK